MVRHRIDIDQGSGSPGLGRQALNVIDRARAVRRRADGKEPGPPAQQPIERIILELVALDAEIEPADFQLSVFRQQQPWR